MHPRPFKAEFERVDIDTRESWIRKFPLGEEGLPTTEVALALVAHFIAHREETFGIDDLSRELFLHPRLVHILCRQLRAADFLEQHPPGSERYRYSRTTCNADWRVTVVAAISRRRLGTQPDSLPSTPTE